MNPFWVETDNHLRLAIVPRPRGGDRLENDIRQIKQAGVDVLVSMLTTDEAAELGLLAEEDLSHAAGIVFRSFSIPDRETPSSLVTFSRFVEDLRAEIRVGSSIAVHCRASIGRSSILLAALLTAEGYQPDDAFRRLSKARGQKVPDTIEQVRWVEHFSKFQRGPEGAIRTLPNR